MTNQWQLMQQEVSTWALHNFGQQDAWQPFLGLVEEIGEYFSVLAGLPSPAIHLSQANRNEMIDALGDQAIFALNLAGICGIQFYEDIVAKPENCAMHLTDRELLGALAAISHAVLKHAQGIRGVDFNDRGHKVMVGLALWFRWAQHQCRVYGFVNMCDVTQVIWNGVKKRDWKANPQTAADVAQRA